MLGTENAFSRKASSSSGPAFAQACIQKTTVRNKQNLQCFYMLCSCQIHYYSSDLCQAPWKYEAPLSGGRGPVCWREASCISGQWECSGEPHFENKGGDATLLRWATSQHTAFIFHFLQLRIFHFKGKKWFGDDGRIIALPTPIKESSTRPLLSHMEEKLDPELQPVYRRVRLSLPPLFICEFTLINTTGKCVVFFLNWWNNFKRTHISMDNWKHSLHMAGLFCLPPRPLSPPVPACMFPVEQNLRGTSSWMLMFLDWSFPTIRSSVVSMCSGPVWLNCTTITSPGNTISWLDTSLIR